MGNSGGAGPDIRVGTNSPGDPEARESVPPTGAETFPQLGWLTPADIPVWRFGVRGQSSIVMAQESTYCVQSLNSSRHVPN